MTVYWPRTLAPLNCDVNLAPRPVGGTPALAGGTQWVQSEAGAWVVNYDSIAVSSPAARKLFKAMALQINGPGTPIVLPIRSSGLAPWPVVAGQDIKSYGMLPFSDGSRFSDGSGWRQPVIAAMLSGDVGMGDTALTIQVDVGGEVEAGMGFSLPGDRYHEIAAVGSRTVSGSSALYGVSILPELRADYAAGMLCNFERPTLLAELVDTDQMQLKGTYSKFAQPSVQFQEYFGS